MQKLNYDLFVIGTGEAGSTAAIICSAAGWKVAIADQLPFGGTCSLRGCNPKRTLAGAAELLFRLKGMKGKGIFGSPKIDWSDLINFKDELNRDLPSMHEEMFSSAGIDTYHGTVTFSGINKVSLNSKVISARKILIATGSKPRTLGIPGEHYLLNSDQLLKEKNFPSKVLFIGAGYISMEFSYILSALGTSVTILEYAPYPLGLFDLDLVSMLEKEMRSVGINIKVNKKVMAVESVRNHFMVYCSADKEDAFEADMVVHGAGRVPNVDHLKLEEADVAHDKYRIRVNKYLQSESNRNVYIAGDAHAEGIQLTPVAEIEGKIVAHNMLYGNSRIPDYRAVPSVVFTHPEIAMAGEPAVHSSDVTIIFKDTSRKHISKRLGLSCSAFKIVIDRGSNKIRGAHLLGYNVDEVINLFAEAIRSGKTVNELKEVLWTFPSVTYDTFYRL